MLLCADNFMSFTLKATSWALQLHGPEEECLLFHLVELSNQHPMVTWEYSGNILQSS